jgi:hypothetical protein
MKLSDSLKDNVRPYWGFGAGLGFTAFGVRDKGCRVTDRGYGLRVYGVRLMNQDLWSRVQGLEFIGKS